MTLSRAQFAAEFPSEGQMIEFKRGVGSSQTSGHDRRVLER